MDRNNKNKWRERLYNVEKYLKEKECKNDNKCIENLDELDKKKKIKNMLCESVINGTKR